MPSFLDFFGKRAKTVPSKGQPKLGQHVLTENQKATLAAIRRYEEKLKPRLGEKGTFSTRYERFLPKKPDQPPEEQKAQELAKNQLKGRFGTLKIPVQVPLQLSEGVVDELKKQNFKLSLTQAREEKEGQVLKLSYETPEGKSLEIWTAPGTRLASRSGLLVRGKEGSGMEKKDNPEGEKELRKGEGAPSEPAKAQEKAPKSAPAKWPFVGLMISKEKDAVALKMSVPSSPSSLVAERSRNQGEAMQRYAKAIEARDGQPAAAKAKDRKDRLIPLLSELLSAGGTSDLLGVERRRIDDVAWHDFSSYEYVLEPKAFSTTGRVRFSQRVLDLLEELDDPALEISELLGFLNHFVEQVERMVLGSISYYASYGYNVVDLEANHERIAEAYQTTLVESGALSKFYEVYFSLPPSDIRRVFLDLMSPVVSPPPVLSGAPRIILRYYNMYAVLDIDWNTGDPVPTALIAEWIEIADNLYQYWKFEFTQGDFQTISSAVERLLEYPFQVFTPATWNLGLRLVHRQEWRPLGIQPGEEIRTIPLGPKQVEKVSTKIFRRTKVTRTSESLKATETTTETTDTTKNSSEIVKEAAETFNWKAEAEGSLDLGVVKFGGGGGASGQSEDKSRSTNTRLTEAVQKTASKLRSETKVVVSTESESTFEITTASEIQNPNDEIPLVYIYVRRQQQYEVLTSLAEVHSVVFIAEEVPLPHQITKEWVRKYDWIISKALLDDSFRDGLTSISQDVPQQFLPSDVQQRIGKFVDDAATFLGSLSSSTSLSLSQVDPTQEAQRAYRETHKEELERKRSLDLLEQKQQRLLQHIRDNILHYCRAIWSQEDPDQRMLRYKKLAMRVPTIWRFVFGSNVIVDASDPRLSQQGILTDGYFEPDLTDPATVRPMTELINPAGPIGFAGNYAIFYLKADAEIDAKHQLNLFDVLHLMRSDYVDPSKPSVLIDPALRPLLDPNSPRCVPIPDPIPREEREEMVDYVPALRAEYESLSKGKKEAFLKDGRQKFAPHYHEYLFRKEFTRRFVVDTNNLILDIEVRDRKVLETFKRAHRYIDVLKELEAMEKMRLENVRRYELIQAKKYGDPDIEKVTVVTTGKALADRLNIDVASEEEVAEADKKAISASSGAGGGVG